MTMSITAETIARHELGGLPVRIVDSSDHTVCGTSGVVRLETHNTIEIDRSDGDARDPARIQKAGTVFEFDLTEVDATESQSTTCVRVDGRRLVGNPAKRTETTGDTPWQ